MLPYSNHLCNFFDFDTFGGHIKVRQIYLGRARQPSQEIRTPSWGRGAWQGRDWEARG